jgi:outer membrane protein OmpA-like peptidoglycan-associated protein
VEGGYTWQDARGQSAYRLPGAESIGWWLAVAFLLSILVHVALFYALGRITMPLGFGRAAELQTGPVNVQQVEVRPAEWEQTAPMEDIEQPPKDVSSLLEEIDLLDKLPQDTEIEIRPDITEPELAIKLENPAMSGSLAGELSEPVPGPAIATEIAELGRMDEALEVVPEGRVIIDPGAAASDMLDPDAFTEELLKKGAEGVSDRGALKDFTSLDDMIGMTGNTLLDKKAMIGSDLLFEYNSDVLREHARLSLMKVAMLIDRNPGLHCWIEGYTDLFGGDEFNLDLSRRRAAAVKAYLVGALQLPPDKLVVRGFGKERPVVAGGSVDEQALNRRVEIKMRKEPGADDAVIVKPKRTIPVVGTSPPAPQAPPPAASVVPPARPRLMPPAPPAAPRAQPVPEPQVPLRAVPAPAAEPPRAQPVGEPPPPKAQPVGETPRAVLVH